MEKYVQMADFLYEMLDAKRMSISNLTHFLWGKATNGLSLGSFQAGKEILKDSFADKAIKTKRLASGRFREEETGEWIHVRSYPVFENGVLIGAITYGQVDLESMLGEAAMELASVIKTSEEALVGSNEIKDEMNKISEMVKSFQHQLSVISSISERTQILGINASIEANRSHNGAFQIIAKETQNLSDQITKATANLSDDLENLVVLSKGGAEAIDRTQQEMQEIEKAMQGLIKLVERIENFEK